MKIPPFLRKCLLVILIAFSSSIAFASETQDSLCVQKNNSEKQVIIHKGETIKYLLARNHLSLRGYFRIEPKTHFTCM